MPPPNQSRRLTRFVDAMLLVLIAGSLFCLAVGVSIPILELQKKIDFTLLGISVPIVNVRNEVTILGAISELLQSHSLVLGAVILLASILLPLGKNLVIATVWIRWRRGHLLSGRLPRMMTAASRFSLTEPFAIGVTIVAMKLGPELQVKLGPGCAYFLTSVFASIAATEIVRRFAPMLTNRTTTKR